MLLRVIVRQFFGLSMNVNIYGTAFVNINSSNLIKRVCLIKFVHKQLLQVLYMYRLTDIPADDINILFVKKKKLIIKKIKKQQILLHKMNIYLWNTKTIIFYIQTVSLIDAIYFSSTVYIYKYIVYSHWNDYAWNQDSEFITLICKTRTGCYSDLKNKWSFSTWYLHAPIYLTF